LYGFHQYSKAPRSTWYVTVLAPGYQCHDLGILTTNKGYDVSDYEVIDPPYGDISDVDVLKDKLHERGMKLVLDLVVNHTSDQHEWFKESRKSKDNPYRDWYVWRPAKYDADGNRQPPNNWQGHFQGEATI
jgi:glycosidase